MKWYRCIGKAAWSKETKVQQSSAQSGEPESIAKEEISQRDVRRTGKHSKREEQPKRRQKNVQNAKRSVNKYWSRKVGYA